MTDSEARELAGELIESERADMSWILAFLGFAALVILHEAGHFFAAKAVGMRVERFALFFPPLIARRKWGETEYAIGVDPARRLREDHRHEPGGGDPAGARAPRLLPPAGVEADRRDRRRPVRQHRAGVRDPRRRLHGTRARSSRRRWSAPIEKGTPGGERARAGRRDPRRRRQARSRGDSYREQQDQIGAAIGAHKGTPVEITVRRDGREQTVTGTTFYDNAAPSRYRFGFGYDPDASAVPAGPVRASGLAVEPDVGGDHAARSATSRRSSCPRSARSSAASSAATRRRARRSRSTRTTALVVLALISLSLGVINLFPFLPLDGGHIFWALAEKVRGKAIPFSVMERAGFVGFALVIALFLVGLDERHRPDLANGGFRLR